jgi:hypothetical protein
MWTPVLPDPPDSYFCRLSDSMLMNSYTYVIHELESRINPILSKTQRNPHYLSYASIPFAPS